MKKWFAVLCIVLLSGACALHPDDAYRAWTDDQGNQLYKNITATVVDKDGKPVGETVIHPDAKLAFHVSDVTSPSAFTPGQHITSMERVAIKDVKVATAEGGEETHKTVVEHVQVAAITSAGPSVYQQAEGVVIAAEQGAASYFASRDQNTPKEATTIGVNGNGTVGDVSNQQKQEQAQQQTQAQRQETKVKAISEAQARARARAEAVKKELCERNHGAKWACK